MLTAAVVLFVAALIELTLTLSLSDPDEGANIGAGVAMVSLISAAVAAGLVLVIRRAPRGFLRGFVGAIAMIALAFAANGVVLIFFGIIEEL